MSETFTHDPVSNDRPAIASTLTLPAAYYTDPDHFRRELEAIHFQRWIYAGRDEDLPAPDHYILCEVGGESIVVLRHSDGRLRAFYNVCRHRGTRLLAEPSGTLKGHLQCPYHAWTYDYEGCLIGAPFMDKTDGFELADYPLHGVAVDTWDGHVFIHLSPPAAPLADQLADLPTRFRNWQMQDLRRGWRQVYSLACNWKLVIQNYSECLHCPLLHPQLQQLSHFMSGENAPPHPSYLGGRMDLRDGFDSLTTDGTSPWTPLPLLDATQRRGVYYFAVLPNLLLNLHPDYMLTFQLLPRAHDRTDIVCEWYFHPKEMAEEGFDPAPAVDFWDLTNRQDWEVSERAQQGIGSRAYRPGPYSNREELLTALDRWVLQQTASALP